MGTYRGEAVVELDDGETIPVTANLTSMTSGTGMTDWSGIVQVIDQHQARLRNVAQGQLRIGDKTAAFIVTNSGGTFTPGAAFERIEIMANGDPAPF